MNKFFVSIVMITYGHEKYIEEAINGVLMQECNFDIELIISNDCSPDKTDQVIQTIMETHPKSSSVRYISHEKNLGMMPNFLFTLQQAKSKYIAICEGDDYWTDPLKLQKQVDFLEGNPDYTFSVGIVDMLIEKTGKIIKRKEHVDPNKNDTYTLKDYLKAPFSQTSSFMFRNGYDTFPDWFQNVHAGDQSLVVIKTGIVGKIKYHNELFSIYRVNDKSISYSVSYDVYVKFLDTLKIWQTHLGENYDVIFKIIDFKYRQYIKLNNCKNIFDRFYYIIKIRAVDLYLKFV